jgi:hypothetical protein
MAGLHDPLPTLRRYPRGCRRTARGRCGSLFLHRSGLSPPTPCQSPGALPRFLVLSSRCAMQHRSPRASHWWAAKRWMDRAISGGTSYRRGRNVLSRRKPSGRLADLTLSQVMPKSSSLCLTKIRSFVTHDRTAWFQCVVHQMRLTSFHLASRLGEARANRRAPCSGDRSVDAKSSQHPWHLSV